MQITHQEARSLIQFRADQVLKPDKREILNAHLKDCVECTDYANQIQEMEATLRVTLNKHWSVRSLPPLAKDIKVKSLPIVRLYDLLTTRSALAAISVLFFIISFLQLSLTSNDSPGSVIVGVPAIPTPSLPLTSTHMAADFGNCQMIRYEVHRADTLKSIAERFSVSEAAILGINNLQTEYRSLPTSLMIPRCELTPTGTTHPPTSTTNTPALELTTYTPG